MEAPCVRRFILAVTASANSKVRLEGIDLAPARFAEVDVSLKVWAQRQIRQPLRPPPASFRNVLAAGLC
jgi:hypothetical protein